MTSHAQIKASTGHIRTCRDAWHDHLDRCLLCVVGEQSGHSLKCPTGEVIYGEYVASITANRECEHLEATDAPQST